MKKRIPQLLLIVSLVLVLLGSVLAVGILTLLFVLDDRPRTPEHISMYGGIPTLAVLPSMKEVKRSARKNIRFVKMGRRV